MTAYQTENMVTRLTGRVQAIPTPMGGDYEGLKNKPRINGVELVGNLNSDALGISGAGGAGMSASARDLLISILRKAVYTSDQEDQITALEAALKTGSEGDGEQPSVPGVYTVTRNLTHAVADNSVNAVEAGSAYRCTISAEAGYVLTSVYASMGGVAVYSKAFAQDERIANYTMDFAAVTGNVVISAVASQVDESGDEPSNPVTYSVTYQLTNATATNSATTVEENSAYECQINAAEGYVITSVHATMGAQVLQNLTFTPSQKVSNAGVVTSAVTGNIVITVVAVQKELEPVRNLFDKNTMVIEGGFVGTGAAVNNSATAAYAIIPITAGKTYSISMKVPLWSNGNSGNKLIKDASGNNLSVITIDHNLANGDYYCPMSVYGTNDLVIGTEANQKGLTFTAPEGGTEFWMTVRYGENDAAETLMVEEGDTVHDYVAFEA